MTLPYASSSGQRWFWGSNHDVGLAWRTGVMLAAVSWKPPLWWFMAGKRARAAAVHRIGLAALLHANQSWAWDRGRWHIVWQPYGTTCRRPFYIHSRSGFEEWDIGPLAARRYDREDRSLTPMREWKRGIRPPAPWWFSWIVRPVGPLHQAWVRAQLRKLQRIKIEGLD